MLILVQFPFSSHSISVQTELLRFVDVILITYADVDAEEITVQLHKLVFRMVEFSAFCYII